MAVSEIRFDIRLEPRIVDRILALDEDQREELLDVLELEPVEQTDRSMLLQLASVPAGMLAHFEEINRCR